MLSTVNLHLYTMDMARIQRGGFELVTDVEFNLASVVDDLMTTLEASTSGKANVNIVKRVRLGGLGGVRLDTRKVMRVILNLVSNAVKFTQRGRVDRIFPFLVMG